jgi:acyl-CoA reductase-like NAD-dependent aldehyde dehydrogenase
MDRLDIPKTHKLFIAGAFPRSESGRSLPITASRGTVHISCASRKDLRAAVEAARAAFGKWRSATAYNRGQILYRMAEMLEGRKAELADAISEVQPPSTGARRQKAPAAPARRAAQQEVDAAIDRLVCFGGWADKYAQVLGCNNPVAGPYYNFTIPEPTGIVGIIAPDQPPLLGLISLLAPPLCAGNTLVALASESNPLPAIILAEVCATSDVPAGVINILTGLHDELIPQFATHREINAISASEVSPVHAKTLREGAGDNLKRVTIRPAPLTRPATRGKPSVHETAADADSPWTIEPFVEFKTIWHPSGA